jgi:excisionase family DNA binding protein
MHSNRPLESNLLLTASQAADSLAISPRKLWGMTTSGEIPHIRLGRCVRYPVTDLEQWIRDQTQEANHDPSNT